jgi:phosphoglycerol transferase MdoB-like AlkP superfamily enzyme
MSSNTNRNGGIGVLGLLGVAFVVLKLTGFIDWSWWWVTAPFWGGFAFALVLAFVALFIAAAAKMMDR